MRSSQLHVLTLLAAAAACLTHAGAEPAAPRRSLTTIDLPPTGPSSDHWAWCWESLLALGFCKHDLLASFLAGRPAPRECCQAFDEAGHHCGPFARAFLGSILPRGLLEQCAHQAVTAAPTRLPSQRRAPPRAPTLETGPRASGGARQPPPLEPEARTDARSPPPRAPAGASSGTHGSPPEVSVREGEESPPEPKVIVAGGSAGGRARRAPGAPLAAAAAPPPQKGVPAARPSVKARRFE